MSRSFHWCVDGGNAPMENKSAAVGCALRPFANGSEHVRVRARRRPTAVPRAYDIPPPQSHLRSLTHSHSHTHSLTHTHTRTHTLTHAHTCAQTLVHGLTRFAALAPSFAVCTLETVLFPVPTAAASSTEGAAPNRANGRPARPAGAAGSTSGLRLPRALAAVGSLAVTPGRSAHARGSDAYGPDRAEACSARAWQCGRAGGRGCGRSGNSHLGRCGSFVRSFPVRFVTGALCGRRRTRGVRTNRHAFLRRS